MEDGSSLRPDAGIFDSDVGRAIALLEKAGELDNTIVVMISDNGASAEGMEGSVAELNAQNGIPSTVAEHIAVVEQLGGLGAIGGAVWRFTV